MPEPQLNHGVDYLPTYSDLLCGVAWVWESDKNLMTPYWGSMLYDPIWWN